MKTKNLKTPFLICLVLAAIGIAASIFGLLFSTKTAKADDYRLEIERFDAKYDVKNDRSMHVTEDITIKFVGYDCTGFFRDIPVNGGEIIKNVKCTYQAEENGFKNEHPYYEVNNEYSGFITLDIGDYTNKHGKTFTFGIEYDYILNKVTKKEKNLISLNTIGFGNDAPVNEANVTVNLPDGFLYGVYYNEYGSSNSQPVTGNGNTVNLHVENLAHAQGVTVDLYFEDGALVSYFDFAPYGFVIAGAVILLIILLLRLFVFNKNGLTPIVNFEAADDMDPLLMGKLIDNKVDPEDISALIFYWADRGYIKINFDNQDNPVLIKIYNVLPQNLPPWQHTFYNKIFERGESVSVSSLSSGMDNTLKRITTEVNSAAKDLYTKPSFTCSVIFALLGLALMIIMPILLGVIWISSTLFILTPVFIAAPAVLLYAITITAMYNRLKFKKGKMAALIFAIIVIALVLAVVYLLLVPGYLMQKLPVIILGAICAAIVALSVGIINRSEKYTSQLNHIVGFKNFILLAEKDRIEKLLEDNPELYYHILPYAQVLDVTDKWEDKFKDIAVASPQWATSSTLERVIEFHILNSILRNTRVQMASSLRAKPSAPLSSGLSGGGFGGGFGGFGGGGHGGGGVRGR